jgi:hypothetical protein
MVTLTQGRAMAMMLSVGSIHFKLLKTGRFRQQLGSVSENGDFSPVKCWFDPADGFSNSPLAPPLSGRRYRNRRLPLVQ